jgi:hypothetical protein
MPFQRAAWKQVLSPPQASSSSITSSVVKVEKNEGEAVDETFASHLTNVDALLLLSSVEALCDIGHVMEDDAPHATMFCACGELKRKPLLMEFIYCICLRLL